MNAEQAYYEQFRGDEQYEFSPELVALIKDYLRAYERSHALYEELRVHSGNAHIPAKRYKAKNYPMACKDGVLIPGATEAAKQFVEKWEDLETAIRAEQLTMQTLARQIVDPLAALGSATFGKYWVRADVHYRQVRVFLVGG